MRTPQDIAQTWCNSAAKRLDDSVLVVDQTADALTFGELAQPVTHMAAGLARRGISEQDARVVMLRPGFEFVTARFAVLRDPRQHVKVLRGDLPQWVSEQQGLQRMLTMEKRP